MGEMIFEKLEDMLELLKENKDLIFFLAEREYQEKGLRVDVELRTITEFGKERFLLRYVENVVLTDGILYKDDVEKIMEAVENKKKEIEKKVRQKGFFVVRGDVI